MGFYEFRPYVSVAERKRRAAKKLASLRKKGMDVQPIEIEGRLIAKTFWGRAWCDHMESMNDYENRLPRGRTYARNGSVCHLSIKPGEVDARVMGSEFYTVEVAIKKLRKAKWNAVKKQCAGKIGSLLELLQGKFSDEVMQVVTDPDSGLFPLVKEISYHCDCPDWATMCKHVAAVMYGIGARLDVHPELLFTLRGVDHEELVAVDAEAAVSSAVKSGKSKKLAGDDLSDVFGIELGGDITTAPVKKPRKRAPAKKAATKKPVAKKPAVKKPAAKRKKSTASHTAGKPASKPKRSRDR